MKPEFIELTMTDYGTISADKITFNGSFKVPDLSSTTEKKIWKDTLTEIRELLQLKGLMIS
jgi:hypothetical protein